MEPGGAALGALAQELVDEAVADVAGVGQADGIELHDRPFVAGRLALDADQAGDPAVLLVDVHQVVRTERAERQPEEAEHPDRRAAHRQAERSGRGAVRLAQARQLAERGEVGQARGADLALAARRPGSRSSGLRPAGRVVAAAGALARIVVLLGHRRDQPVEARLPGELGMERRGDDVPLADRHDPAVVEARQDVDVRPRRAR